MDTSSSHCRAALPSKEKTSLFKVFHCGAIVIGVGFSRWRNEQRFYLEVASAHALIDSVLSSAWDIGDCSNSLPSNVWIMIILRN
jgi:hypothetical protein